MDGVPFEGALIALPVAAIWKRGMDHDETSMRGSFHRAIVYALEPVSFCEEALCRNR
jgi:hypothetical protein